MKEDRHKMQLYAVMSQDGKYLRSRGYSGGGKSWVDSLDKAKTWGSIGTAKSQITWWATNYPEYGVPKLVIIDAVVSEVIDQNERVRKSQVAKEQRQAQRDVQRRQREMERARDDFERAQARLREFDG